MIPLLKPEGQGNAKQLQKIPGECCQLKVAMNHNES